MATAFIAQSTLLATAGIAQSTLQVHGISKPIVARVDQLQASSDGGAILLKVIDDRLGLTWRLACAIHDRRQPGKVWRTRSGICATTRLRAGLRLRRLQRRRAAGRRPHPQAAARARSAPRRRPGSQPTPSRFENAVGRADLYRLGNALVDAAY